MGLLQAGIGALSGVLADQWREYFYCPSLPEDVLVRKGAKRQQARSTNTKGSDNIITNGSRPGRHRRGLRTGRRICV